MCVILGGPAGGLGARHRRLQLPCLIDEIGMNGVGVSRRQNVVEATHAHGGQGAVQHDGVEYAMNSGIQTP